MIKMLRWLAVTACLLLAAGLSWAQVPLVPAGAVWKYLDKGINAGTAWRAAGFDDSAWASGPAKLGYGEGDEGTVVSFGPNAGAKYITTYFRRAFQAGNPAGFTGLNLRVRRDDGIVVYLNGTEVYRDNMPAGAVSYTTLAPVAAPDDGAVWQSATLAVSPLVAGTNLLAVEVHQSAASSSDLSFDLELSALTSTPAVVVTRGPYLQIGTPSSMTVRWRTSSATDSVVRYGASATALTASASDAALTTEHSVTLTGLNADTRYFYSVGSGSGTLAGGDANHYFVTAPSANSQRASRIWVLGDAGTGTAEQRQVRDAYASFAGTSTTHLWLQLGDNAYESGSDAEYQANFFDVYPDMLKRSVTWPTLGNHDTAQSTAPPSSLPYFQMFSLPTAGQAGGIASGTRNYYSFDYGNIHFVCLDSMASARSPGSAMLTWLQYDLAANTKDWLIAYWHHPPYTKGSHDSDNDIESIEMRQNVLPILESYGVDLVMAGHSHVYERSYLIDGHYGPSSTFTSTMKKNGGSGRPAETGAYTKPPGAASHKGAVYAVAGASGHTQQGGSLDHPAMFVSMLRLGSLVLDVNGPRMDVLYLTEAGTAADSFSLVKVAGGGNQPPSVSLTAPSTGSAFTAPATINLAAAASDSDGSVQRVEFWQGATLLGTATAPPYAYSWQGVAAGSYVLTARAYDNLGAVATSSPVTVTVAAGGGTSEETLIGKGSVWKYLDNGSNQGTAWRLVGFNDSAWASGAAQLGYGDGDEATVVSYGPSGSNKYITTYFRRLLSIGDPSQYSSLVLNLLRDDGAVVYLNGTEIARSNMPAGTVSSGTLASGAVAGADESTFYPYVISPQLLVGGTNVIAVEVHQAAADSSDISFDLELIGRRAGGGNEPPSVSLTAPSTGSAFTAPATINLAAAASDSDGSVQRVEFWQGATLLGTATAPPYAYTWQGVAAGSYVLTARAYDNLGAVATSSPVTVTVAAGGGTSEETLIGKGSVWKYLDNGSNQGTAWRLVGFNDSAWASGAAQLGYGDGDEATVVSYGPSGSNKYITTYFRRLLSIGDPSQYSSLVLNLLRDDGAVVYLNGTEIARSNMPAGTVSSGTLASGAVAGADESTFYPYVISPQLLVGGTNVIAVEVHQAAADSSDISFDLELIGRRAPR